jgi:hypothetical protein
MSPLKRKVTDFSSGQRSFTTGHWVVQAPTSLTVRTGASESHHDLSRMRLRHHRSPSERHRVDLGDGSIQAKNISPCGVTTL